MSGSERSANCPGCGMLMVAPHGTLPDADADGYCPTCQKERAEGGEQE